MNTFVLDTTGKSLTAVMSGAPVTTNPDFIATYADATATAFTEGANDGTLNGSTPVTLVAAPAASTRRIVKDLVIQNRDTAAVTVTLNYVSAGGTRQIAVVTLAAGETFYNGQIYDSYGNLKMALGTVNLATQISGILPIANGGTGSGTDANARTALGLAIGSDVQAYSANTLIDGITFIFGDAITAPAQNAIAIARVPYAATINSSTIMADASGSAVVDIQKCAFANFPGSLASICSATKPTLSSAQSATDTTLSSWTTAISAGDVLYAHLDSVTTCKLVSVSLKVTKT